MAKLINTFSWSISTRDAFNACRRQHYWSKYAMWDGWKPEAPAFRRSAYRLNKMSNRFMLQGNAVEKAVMWILRQKQKGLSPSTEEAYQTAARPYLNQCWQESTKKLWQTDPKRYCCLHEHYYASLYEERAEAMTAHIISQIRLCLDNFMEKTLPRLENIRPEQEHPIGSVDTGKPESFIFKNVKIYAIPDYVWRDGEQLHIIDWKSGQPRLEHEEQMLVYGLWAWEKLGISPEQVTVNLEYLVRGACQNKRLTATDLEQAKKIIGESVGDMMEYLENGDIAKNIPLPKEDWEMVADLAECRRCNFYELCRPELEG